MIEARFLADLIEMESKPKTVQVIKQLLDNKSQLYFLLNKSVYLLFILWIS